MAYTRITNTRSGSAAIRYAFEEKSHKTGIDRVLMASGSNLDPQFAMLQMRDVWKAHGKTDGKTVQVYRVIQSFGLDELDPSNPADIARANEIGKLLAMELYPDKQALIVTQADGKGGKLHNHVLVNSVGFVDGKSLRGYRKEHDAVAEKTDELLERFEMKPLDTERTRKKRTSQEKRLADAGKYVWKDDLRERIEQGLSDVGVTSQKAFVAHMREQYAVDVTYRGKGITYSFEDANGKKQKSRDGRLGTDFAPETIEERFKTNSELQHKQAGGLIDFDQELELLFGNRKGLEAVPKRLKVSETTIMRDVREEREAREQIEAMDKLHDEALQDNAHYDAMRDAEQSRELEALQKARAEEKERERQQQAERARREQEQLEAKRREQEQRERLRELATQRIKRATSVYTNVAPELVDEFLRQSEALQGQTKNTVTGKRVPYTDLDIYHKSQAVLDHKAGRDRALEDQTEADGPTL